jgi:hypothetical protein
MESPPNDSLTISSNNNENVVVEVDLAQLQVLSTEDEENNEEKKEENTDNVPIVDEINYDVLDVFNHPMFCERVAAWQDLTCNPHCTQVTHSNEYQSRTDLNFSRVLEANAPIMKYRRRRDEVKTVIHWGQRKLLLSEIEFLTLHALPSSIVIYAGAAPGTHIEYLSKLFPDVNFVLVDPSPFTVKERLPQIALRPNTLFTDELAQEFGAMGKDILFISDIRSADPTVLSEEETEQQVAKDMAQQGHWHRLMCARKSMLKFRLSWRAGKTKYLAGEIYLPVWGPVTTTESRLIADFNALEIEYDNTKYEEQMFHFNTVTRVARYRHNIRGEGIDHCYDCTAEIAILRNYFMKRKNIAENDPSLNEQIGRMSRQISRKISSHRKLSSPNPDPEKRKRVIVRRQYVDGRPAYLSENHGHQAEKCHFENKKKKQRKNKFESTKIDLEAIKMNIINLNNINLANANSNNVNINGVDQRRQESEEKIIEGSITNTSNDNKRKRDYEDDSRTNLNEIQGSDSKRPKYSHFGD